VAGAQVGRFLKSHRVLYVPAGWVSRIVGLSPSTSFIAVLLGPLRARLRGSMSADDVLRVLRALDTRSLPYWLAGGWGIDALIGKQNRTHDDLDVIIDDYQRNAPAARQALLDLGFRQVGSQMRKTWMPDLSTFEDGAGHRVELVSVDWNRLASALDPAGSLQESSDLMRDAFTQGTINGVVVPCLSSRVQQLYHSGYPLKETLQQDMTLLQSIFGRPSVNGDGPDTEEHSKRG